MTSDGFKSWLVVGAVATATFAGLIWATNLGGEESRHSTGNLSEQEKERSGSDQATFVRVDEPSAASEPSITNTDSDGAIPGEATELPARPTELPPLPAEGRALARLLRKMTVGDQVALLGRPLDGGAYMQRRALLSPRRLDDVEASPLYNPQGIKLTEEQRGSLEKVLETCEATLDERALSIHDLEMDLVRSGRCFVYAEGDHPPTGPMSKAFYERPDFYLMRMRHVTGGGIDGLYAFGLGMSDQRDLLLSEQTDLMVRAEQDVLAFFNM